MYGWRPMLLMAPAFALGVWWGLQATGAAGLPLAAAGALLLASRYLRRTWKWAGAVPILGLALLCCGLGCWRAGMAVGVPADTDLSASMESAREALELRGRIVNDPVFQPAAPGRSAGYWVFALEAAELRRLPHWQPARGRVSVRLWSAPTRPLYGAVWQLAGVLTAHALDADRARYVWRIEADRPAGTPAAYPLVSGRPRGGGYSMHVSGQAAQGLRPPPRGQPLGMIYALRGRAAQVLGRGLADRPEVAAVLRALALGLRRELPAEVRASFMDTGTFHVFAVSGLHMALLALFVTLLLRLLGVERRHWFWAAAPVLVGFTVMVGLPPSAVRGSLMALLWLLAAPAGRRPDAWSALAAAGLIILAVDPGQLLGPGFLLSFAVVGGLLLAWPVLGAWLNIPVATQFEDRAAWSGRLWRWFLGLGLVSLTAWLAGLPLVARWFNIWSLWSPPANLLTVPLVSLALALAFLALLGSLVHPGVAVFFNWLNIWPVELALRWLGWVARWPGCRQAVSAPSLWSVWCWYLGWWLLLRRAKRYNPRWLKAVGLALLLVWPAAAAWNARGARLQVFNADGVAVVLGAGRAPGAAWLVNAGSRRHARRLARLLDQAGVNRPDLLMLNRPDVRHVGGAEALLDRPPDCLVYAGASGRFRAFAPLSASLAAAGTDLLVADPGTSGRVGKLCWRIADDAAPPNMNPVLEWDDWRVTVSPAAPAGDCALVVIHHAGRALAEICCARSAFGARHESGSHPRLRPAPWQTVTARCTDSSLTLEWEE